MHMKNPSMWNPIIPFILNNAATNHGSKAQASTWKQEKHIMDKKHGINFVHVYQGRIEQTTCMLMWMHDLIYLPCSISAPMVLCVDMWMHVNEI